MKTLLEEAKDLYHQGKKIEAFNKYKELLEVSLEVPEAWYGIALCIDDIALKKYCLNRSLLIQPSNEDAKNLLDTLIKKKNIENSIKEGPPTSKTFNQFKTNTNDHLSKKSKSSDSKEQTHKLRQRNKSPYWIALSISIALLFFGIIALFTKTLSFQSQNQLPSPLSSQATNNAPTKYQFTKVIGITQETTRANIISTTKPIEQGNDLLFFDDFSDKLWTANQWEVDSDVWDISQERFSFIQNGKAFTGSNEWSDYIFSVNTMGEKTIDKIVFFRYADHWHTYYIFLRSSPINDIVLVKTTANFPDHILTSTSYENSTGNWYSIKVNATGNHFQIFVNETLAIDYTDNDSPLLNGRVGIMGMLPSDPGATVFYDNVQVNSIK